MKNTPAPLPIAENIDHQHIKYLYDIGEIDLVVVLGPTASGKTKYAVNLAKSINGEIISADSRQVYKGMDIGTGKDLSEYNDIPYYLIDIKEAGEQYNVFDFQHDFQRAYEQIQLNGSIPILCGGTGLYISAVTAGYKFGGEKHPLSSIRSNDVPNPLSCELEKQPISSACKNDMSYEDQKRGAPTTEPKAYFIGTLVGREERNRRIDLRLDARLKEGMVEEIKSLLDRGVPPEKLISYGLEYKFVTEYVIGQRTYEDMREKLAIAIHQFAKRQMTWFRGMERSGVKIHWVEV